MNALQRNSMNVNEDKENNVSLYNDSNKLKLPATPLHLLKRSNSIINKNNKSKRLSPLKRGGRLPLASKDNNLKSNSFIFKKNNTNTYNNNNNSNENNNNNNIQLSKYPSIVGNQSNKNGLPRMRSLVLKDIDSSEEDDDDDLGMGDKLKLLMNSGTGNNLGITTNHGLNSFIKEKNQEEEIEYRSEPVPELEHIPVGYEKFNNDDISKLKEVNLRIYGDLESEQDNDAEEQDSNDLISLTIVSPNSTLQPASPLVSPETTQPPQLSNNEIEEEDEIHIIPTYTTGLTNDELSDLLDI